MKNLWRQFDNKKTNIGAALLLAAVILQNLTEIWLNTPPVWMANLIETFQWLGGLFSGVGLSHKGLKRKKIKESGKRSD